LQLYKNQALNADHRVVIIGSTKEPENGDIKDMKAFFDKFLYMPYPDYSTRIMIWRAYLEEIVKTNLKLIDEMNNGPSSSNRGNQDMLAKIIGVRTREIMQAIDVSSLGHISEGYSAGAIARTVRQVVTVRRVSLAKTRPITAPDFVDTLSTQPYTYNDDKIAFMEFTRAITGLDDRRKKIEAMVAGNDDEGGAKKEKGGKKK
jgi:SpoVK/Ycf46/Vps4 family AAA+-type ATPase